MVDQNEIIQKTVTFVKKTLSHADGAHDWWHIYRVWQLAKRIAQTERVDLFVVEMGVLLHDVADPKLYGGNEKIGRKKVVDFLISENIQQDVIDRVMDIVDHISFRETFNTKNSSSIELQIAQDADRLDAIGAIGIARAFTVGGVMGKEIYNPQNKPNIQMTREQYMKKGSSSINHFYEKLLLLKDKMNTKTGKDMAQERHAFMEQYLAEFYKEWEGEK